MQPFYTYPQQYSTYQPYQTPYNPRQQQTQPSYQYQPQQPFTPPMSASNGSPQPIVAYVNGIEGAKGYVLFPNQTAVLFDSDDKEKFYVKNADANGVPSLEKYTRIKEDFATESKSDYVPKKEFEELREMVDGIRKYLKKGDEE